MKARIIRMTLARKFDHFLESIEDATLKEEIKNNTIITGGCIVSLLQNEDVSDFDLYFRTSDVAFKVAKYYIERFLKNPPTTFKDNNGQVVRIGVKQESDRIRIVIKSAGVAGEIGQNDYQYFETLPEVQADEAQGQFLETAMKNADDADDESAGKLDEDKNDKKAKKYRPIFITSNAITLSNKMQIVVRFFGEPDQIHDNYDFVHCTNYWTSWDRQLTLRPDALEAILTKDLRYVGSKYPICSLIRSRKFIKRGWNINAGQYVKMAWQIGQLDLTNLHVLEEQLIGVDAAYFRQLIEVLQKKDPEKVDGAYLMSVIDKVF